ncbi:hypothetical protein LUZ63_014382 [Rhynchospora breviuscula]|uniref:TPX2 C-terminal domain-containing protein n=1 Tax=Rhynchospora breviuscula TaxID=2022672 RepID=A0A9Q0CAE2_9POAL|nr:hypothetical protein LUZ63_014382 [Rhynchospora breviuscula]
MGTRAKKSLNQPAREFGTSRNLENSNPNFSLATPRRNPTAISKSSSTKSGNLAILSKTLAPPSISRGKASMAQKKLPLKDSEISDSTNVSRIASPVCPAHLMRFAKQNQRTRIRAPLSSPMEPTPSEKRQDRNLKIDLDGVSNKQDAKSEVNVSDGAPDLGEGRVMFLAKAFEKLFTENEEDEAHKGDRKDSTRVFSEETEVFYSVESTLSEIMDPGEQSSVKSKWNRKEKENISFQYSETRKIFPYMVCLYHRCFKLLMASLNTLNRASSMYVGGNRIKRNSTGSSGRSWTKKPKITNPHPFMLKTEERGRMKEELFLEKTKEMLLEEERLRIPVAQGLPWTTDVPEYPSKPPIKESTEPLDLILHTDLRAIDRAEFDHQVAERINFIEEIKSERERQRKMEEEEEIKKLRKELVPKAQPMPSFDRPFVPKKSILPHTIPKEPKFNSKQ